ncbi:hypothetical protein KUCAC02_030231 [Chaenocephalus aceratus]|uniref:Uncharacterized protein n=1 Tax=Chaenocephalus aceratus TaxID=36190 RepID=A0ACB9XK77_CHAAC|nr:hypothetical protein KUCAC02_030231 [Chaenocephalus aceratus]
MKLLKKETLRSPQYLVIHTGTTDLNTLRRDPAEADHHPCCEETQQLSSHSPRPNTPRGGYFPPAHPLHNISSRDMQQQLLLVSLPAYSSGAMLQS